MPHTNWPAKWMEDATRAVLDPKHNDHTTADGHLAFTVLRVATGEPVPVYVVTEDTEGGYAAGMPLFHTFRLSAARARCAAVIRRARARGDAPARGQFRVESFHVFP